MIILGDEFALYSSGIVIFLKFTQQRKKSQLWILSGNYLNFLQYIDFTVSLDFYYS